ncbi:hypothetical protein [Desulfosporosinus fructosivorans]
MRNTMVTTKIMEGITMFGFGENNKRAVTPSGRNCPFGMVMGLT